MNISTFQTKKILTGNYSFVQLGFSMLITRMKNIYSKDPSQETLQRCTDEINAFLLKYQSIMGEDFVTVSNL